MSRFVVCVCIVASCASGCRSAGNLTQEQLPSYAYSKASPTFEQMGKVFTPQAVPVAKERIANNRQDSFYNAARQVLHIEPDGAPREPEDMPHPAEAGQMQQDAVRQVAVPSAATKKGVEEKGRGEIQKGAEKSAESVPSSPAAVFTGLSYVIGTLFGTVFTCIFAPVIVEVLKARIGSSRGRLKA